MNIKRLFAIALSVLIAFSLTACKENKEPQISKEITTIEENEAVTDTIFEEIIEGTTVLSVETSETTVISETEESSSSLNETTSNKSDNPADWKKEKIVEVYKNAARKSNAAVKSTQSIALKSISVNNGEYEGLFEFITPIMSKLLADNSSEKDGITGGYNNLTASDIAAAKAYKVGNNIAIEMVMKEQVSGARDDALEGTVGHAITAVGDISVVIKQLDDLGLPLEISEIDTKIYYTNPVVKVLINNNGEIINGTWSYTVDINLNNYKAFGKKVDTTSVVMDNIITVNGGFKK